MRTCRGIFAFLLLLAAGIAFTPRCALAATSPESRDDQYVAGPDWQVQPGTPKGQTFTFVLDHSKIFPGTRRTITVYVPAQYTGARPACVYVGLDGIVVHAPGFDMDTPVVFDNLIAKHEMPVTIGIGLEPGTVASADGTVNPRFNRSAEFDALNTNLADFLLQEVFPQVERHKAPDGRTLKLSADPNDRAVGGGSTGGIGSFTIAWQRPDAFRRVFTAIGTFVGMRGGDRYPVLVRKTEPKPIRIFMQDGSNDEWLGGPELGDWWMSNQTMERALAFAGYSVEHVWGEGTHNPRHPKAILPDALRWLWKDWPLPVTAGESQNTFLKDILQPGEQWQSVPHDDPIAHELAANTGGHRALGPDGREYRTDSALGTVTLIRGDGTKTVLERGLKGPSGITLTADGLWLAVAESKSHWGFSYRVQSDGTVQDKQRFYWFHVPDEADDSGAGAWVTDREGRLYAATRMGIQVFDRNGRVRAILPVPGGAVTDLGFAEEHLDTLYVVGADGKAYRRKFKASGVAPSSAPIELPAWGPG